MARFLPFDYAFDFAHGKLFRCARNNNGVRKCFLAKASTGTTSNSAEDIQIR
ncbi:MAG: hypothetical protein ACYSU3_01100 [Planctomycetota bacterium]